MCIVSSFKRFDDDYFYSKSVTSKRAGWIQLPMLVYSMYSVYLKACGKGDSVFQLYISAVTLF